MRDFMFKVTPDMLVLRVSFSEGHKMVVSWMNVKALRPVEEGPVVT